MCLPDRGFGRACRLRLAQSGSCCNRFLRPGALPHSPIPAPHAFSGCQSPSSALVCDELQFHIVSLDGDFSSARDSSAANPKLVSEWKAKTGGALHVYGSLSQFAKSHFGNISLPSDVKKSSAISKLVTTTNFENTHKQISNLEEVFDEITVEEALIIFQAMIDNNQIYWISDDQDVMNFYKKLHGKFLFETTVEMDKQLYEKAKYLGRVDKRDSQTRLVLIQDCFLRGSHGSRGFVGRGVGADRAATAA